MTLEWDRAYLTVHELLCSHGLYQSNLNQIKNMTRRYLCSSKNASTICEEFKSHPVPFKELDSNIQLFLIQVVHLLTAQSVLDELYELVTTYSTQQTAISWTHVFALVSSIAVSARGGIVLVKGFIRKLLVFVFQPVSQNEEIESPVNVFEMLPGEVCGQPEDGQAFPTQFSVWNLFCFALRLARQLSAEDVRVTGFTYTQWWIETFCSSTMNAPTSVLRSRSDVTLLIEWLIELLPWEDDPRLLQTQLTHKPFWPVHSTGQKKINNNAQSVMDSPEDPILMDTEVVMAELESIDARSRDCCVQRWNDYVEIARGRLAELREQNQKVLSKDSSNFLVSGMVIGTSYSPTPGWDEVRVWIDEVCKQMSIDSATATGNQSTTVRETSVRIPQGFTEANLFQPRKLRTVLIPALLGATEIAELSETQKTAHDLLLAAIRQAGLGNLLELGREAPSHTESKRAKSRRAKPTNTVKQSTMQTRLGTLTRPINTRSRTARSARRV